jgi:hypothetical protein
MRIAIEGKDAAAARIAVGISVNPALTIKPDVQEPQRC